MGRRAHTGALLPDDPIERAEALALEDDFDRNLGPATRRWGYAQLIREPRVIPHIVDRVPRWQALALRLARLVAMRAIASGLGINAAGIERSRAKEDRADVRANRGGLARWSALSHGRSFHGRRSDVRGARSTGGRARAAPVPRRPLRRRRTFSPRSITRGRGVGAA